MRDQPNDDNPAQFDRSTAVVSACYRALVKYIVAAEHRQQCEALNESDIDANPFIQFKRWFDLVLEAKLPEPNAMTLATASRDGIPSARIVLLKSFDDHGFVFFTNYDSQKGRELTVNPNAALVFFWPQFARQVRIVGGVTRATRAEAEDYFRTRPLGSRLGAWASTQSEVLPSREELERRYAEFAQKYGEDVPCPPNWGGFRLTPATIEFWQARQSRLHDRFRYSRLETIWKIERLSP